mmetsp:Transcript_46808/g.111442  ORF Transcript_46808/g.111442 Transcript_46808/m.111442 type:complete len:232 (-) Transcript_46808:476-1171(-)
MDLHRRRPLSASARGERDDDHDGRAADQLPDHRHGRRGVLRDERHQHAPRGRASPPVPADERVPGAADRRSRDDERRVGAVPVRADPGHLYFHGDGHRALRRDASSVRATSPRRRRSARVRDGLRGSVRAIRAGPYRGDGVLLPVRVHHDAVRAPPHHRHHHGRVHGDAGDAGAGAQVQPQPGCHAHVSGAGVPRPGPLDAAADSEPRVALAPQVPSQGRDPQPLLRLRGV